MARLTLGDLDSGLEGFAYVLKVLSRMKRHGPCMMGHSQLPDHCRTLYNMSSMSDAIVSVSSLHALYLGYLEPDLKRNKPCKMNT